MLFSLPGVAQWIECSPAEPKGRHLDSQLGYMPRLQARSPVGGRMRSNHTLMFFSLSSSVPLSLNINK